MAILRPQHLTQALVFDGSDELIEVNHHDILEFVHVTIETVVVHHQLPPVVDLPPGPDVQVPREDFHISMLHMIPEDTADLLAGGPVVQGEVACPEYLVQREELHQVQCHVVVRMDGLHTDSNPIHILQINLVLMIYVQDSQLVAGPSDITL